MRRFLALLCRHWKKVLVGLFCLSLGGLVWFFPGKHIDNIRAFLDSEFLSIDIGSFQISPYVVFKGLFVFILLFWIASHILKVGEARIHRMRRLTPSNRELLSKGFQSLVYAVVFFFGLDILGINLKTFAFLGGAIGIGVGFGLQKITSNFVSGLILLAEKSVRVGDLISLPGICGFVRHTGARFTNVELFDGKEVMVPNEDFMTNRVTNWTFSNTRGRITLLFSLPYDANMDKARRLIVEVAEQHPLCAPDPTPACYLKSMSGAIAQLALYFWVDNVTAGVFGVKSEVTENILKKLQANDIPLASLDLTTLNNLT